MTSIINNIGDFIKNYTNSYSITGVIRLVIDLLMAGFCVYLVIRFFMFHTKRNVVIITISSSLFLLLLIIIFDLRIMILLYKWGLIIFGAALVVYYAPEIRNFFNSIGRNKLAKSYVSDEDSKEALINTIVTTVDYLSRRSIGALITIEKEHSLNAYIDKAIKLESLISFELLITIFSPGTALHDGAVIIRGTMMMCASAFLPSSDKADIPKNYGSRHRAAIGISEVSDAFTIVVSEETGLISTTIDGTITSDITLENLRISLNQNIIVK